MSEEVVKKADQATINKMEARLKQDSTYMSDAALSQKDAAQALMTARTASGGDTAFTKDGRAVAALGDNVAATFQDDLAKFEKKEELEEEEAPADDGASPDKGAKKDKEKEATEKEAKEKER